MLLHLVVLVFVYAVTVTLVVRRQQRRRDWERDEVVNPTEPPLASLDEARAKRRQPRHLKKEEE